jgi:hypothetical protein
MYKEKRVGKRKSIEEFNQSAAKIALNADQWLRTVSILRCTKRVCKKGIYKFKTFEEADRWMEKMILMNSQKSLR